MGIFTFSPVISRNYKGSSFTLASVSLVLLLDYEEGARDSQRVEDAIFCSRQVLPGNRVTNTILSSRD